MTDKEMWKLAVYTTFQRLGVLPSAKKHTMLVSLSHMSAEEGRKAKRKYRKAWRRAVAALLREFDGYSIKDQEMVCVDWSFTQKNGIDGVLDMLNALRVGRRPDMKGRRCRLHAVRYGERFSREFRKVAIELGLMRRREDFALGKKNIDG